MSKIFTKTISLMVSLMVLAGCISVMPVGAGKFMSGDIFFETDFEDFSGLSDSEARRMYFVDTNYGAEAWATNSTIDEVIEENGNVGMAVSSTATTEAEANQQKVQLRFTLNKAENKTRVGGKLYISYEIEADENMRQSFWRYDSVDEGEGKSTRYLFYMDYPAGLFYANNDDFFQWGNKANSKPLALNNRYFVEQVIDFDNHMYYSFVNGDALTPVSIEKIDETIGLLELVIAGEVKFFDNLKVAYMKSDSFKVSAEKVSANQFEFSFTEGVKFTDGVSCLAGNISVLNENRPAGITNIEMVSPRKAIVTLGANIGDRYTITFGNVENCTGTKLANTEISVNNSKLLYSYDGSSTSGMEGKWKGVVSSVNDADAEDGKAIVFTQSPSVTSSETYLEMFLGDYIYMEGDLEIEYRMKVNEMAGMTIVNLGEWNNPNGNRMNGIFLSGADKQPYYCNTTGALTGSAASLHGNWGRIDSENYHTYKTVYHFDEETVDVYIDGVLKKGNLVINNFDSAKNAKAVRYLNLNMKPVNGATDAAPPQVHFDYIKVSQKIKAPYLKSAYMIDGETKYDIIENPDGIPVTADKLEIELGGNVKAAWVSESKIAVKLYSETVETSFNYDKTNRICTLTFADDFFFNTKYGIDLLFNDWHSAPIQPSWIYFNTVKKYEVETAELFVNNELTTEAALKAGDVVSVKLATVNNASDKAVQLVLAAYENEEMVAAGITYDTLINGEKTITATLTLPETGENFNLRAFLWSGDGSLTPLTSSIEFE